MGPHSLITQDGLGQKDAWYVEIQRHSENIDEVCGAAWLQNWGHAGATEQAENPSDGDEPQLAEHKTAEQKGVDLNPVRGHQRLQYLGQILSCLEGSRYGHLGQRALWQLWEKIVCQSKLAHSVQCKKGDDMPQTWFTGSVGGSRYLIILCGEGVLDFRRQAEPTLGTGLL